MFHRPVSRRAGMLAGGLLALPRLAIAQAWPGRPIRLVVGFAPGGSTDAVARIVAAQLTASLGKPVVVETRTGAAGNLATEMVVNAPPDGYTLLLSAGSQIVVSPHASVTLSVDPVAQLAHAAMICEGEFLVVIPAQLPVRDVAEFVALTKRDRGRMNYGSPGTGGILHIAGELFRLRTGAEIEAVHYRGTGPIITDMVAGQLQMTVASVSVAEPFLRDGKLRAILALSKQRLPELPEVPSSGELGLADMDAVTLWLGLHAPGGTPDAILDRLNAVLAEGLRSEEMSQRLQAAGLRPAVVPRADFVARIRSDHEVYGRIIRAANIRGE